MIVGVTGTAGPFDRLLSALAEHARRQPGEPIWAQHGEAELPAPLAGAPSEPRAALIARMADADVVVCHAGCGTIADAFRAGRLPVVVPRRAALGEHLNDHQLELASALERAGRVIVVHEMGDLHAAIEAARGRRPPPAGDGAAGLRTAVLGEVRSRATRGGLRPRLAFALFAALSRWTPLVRA